MDAVFSFFSGSEADTDRLGAALADALPDGSVVALRGTLGAGKTRLVRAIAEASGVPEGCVASPTFVLLGEYRGRRTLYHFDAYRLSGAREFAELGVDEYFRGDGVCIVEWADKVEATLPADHLWIEIEIVDENRRRF